MRAPVFIRKIIDRLTGQESFDSFWEGVRTGHVDEKVSPWNDSAEVIRGIIARDKERRGY